MSNGLYHTRINNRITRWQIVSFWWFPCGGLFRCFGVFLFLSNLTGAFLILFGFVSLGFFFSSLGFNITSSVGNLSCFGKNSTGMANKPRWIITEHNNAVKKRFLISAGKINIPIIFILYFIKLCWILFIIQ